MNIVSMRFAGVAMCAAVSLSLFAGPVLAQPSYAVRQETIKGRISSFDGKYQLTVRDERGYVDRVTLHDGTIINPTGLRLVAGMSVTIVGRTAGNTFAAYEIDTPYSLQPPAYEYPPAYGYPPAYPYPAGYLYPEYYPVYPYPAYPYPAYYPYPSYYSLNLGILIGGRRGHFSHGRLR